MPHRRRSAVLDHLSEPIVLAPMAGGPSTPALAAAVSGAGGLGFLAAGYKTATDVRADMDAVRAATGRPFGVNLFVPSSREAAGEGAVRDHLAAIASDADRLGVKLGEPRWDDDGWGEKLGLLEASPVAVVSFTFGCPPRDVVERVRRTGAEAWVTVTEPAEAAEAAASGADALVVQGVEAGGHRGSFVDREGAGDIGLIALLRLVSRAVDLPLVAAGGIADGHGIAAALAAGAAAAALGTAFMRAPEAGTWPGLRDALATQAPTGLTRAFSGRLARGIVNRFMREHSQGAPAAYPQVHHATAPLRAAGRQRNDPDVVSLWAGQAHALTEALPAADLVRKLGRECRQALREAVLYLER